MILINKQFQCYKEGNILKWKMKLKINKILVTKIHSMQKLQNEVVTDWTQYYIQDMNFIRGVSNVKSIYFYGNCNRSKEHNINIG